jgi:hypothetical protein
LDYILNVGLTEGMYYPDLSPCTEFPFDAAGKLIAVGWLDPGMEFERGEVREKFVRKLAELLYDPWQPVVAMGTHACGFCRLSGGPGTFRLGPFGPEAILGVSNVFVPGDGFLYVAPSLILHYIDAHEYSPPTQFQQAVMACPPMCSMEYLEAILENGPQGMMPKPS